MTSLRGNRFRNFTSFPAICLRPTPVFLDTALWQGRCRGHSHLADSTSAKIASRTCSGKIDQAVTTRTKPVSAGVVQVRDHARAWRELRDSSRAIARLLECG